LKRSFFGIVVAALVGCGGGSGDFHSEFVAACNESGDGSEEFCECMADKADESLNDEQKEFILAGMRGDQDRVSEMEDAMAMQHQEEMGRFMAGAFECGMVEAVN
jgi:hypothetical protein